MVKTGRRATALRELLGAAGLRAVSPPTPPRVADLSTEGVGIVGRLYESFGGRLTPAALLPGAWDLAVDGLLVELDEELHFNRYRRLTLAEDWATELPWTANYRRLCSDFESRCVAAGSWGSRWTNSSCAKHFGDADPPKVLGDRGAPRWKQRALYDAIKDLFAVGSATVAVARLSIYDDLTDASVGDALDGRATAEPNALVELVRRRSSC